MRGVCDPLSKSAPRAVATIRRRVDTPHPSASGAHLLPQGEKEERGGAPTLQTVDSPHDRTASALVQNPRLGLRAGGEEGPVSVRLPARLRTGRPAGIVDRGRARLGPEADG